MKSCYYRPPHVFPLTGQGYANGLLYGGWVLGITISYLSFFLHLIGFHLQDNNCKEVAVVVHIF